MASLRPSHMPTSRTRWYVSDGLVDEVRTVTSLDVTVRTDTEDYVPFFLDIHLQFQNLMLYYL